MNTRSKAEAFLKIAPQFRLGELETEKPHPKTTELSALVKTDLIKAISILKEIDLEALEVIKKQGGRIMKMKADIEKTIHGKHKVFLVGCGSTGRLSLVLETLWRKKKAGTGYENAVISFMAGGDTALIKSIENFEDYPDYAVRQLEELGFSDGDLLIASTEGGETPFVIGATEKAVEISTVLPYFLYCNPDEILMDLTERTTNILKNSSVNRINLSVGPMAISGSTRMQSSTILMYAIGLALLDSFNEVDIKMDVNKFIKRVKETDYSFLSRYIIRESNVYKTGSFLVYTTHEDLGISILTDTTERSPTFTLHPFENYLNRESKPSLSYLCLPDYHDSKSAWKGLLNRMPRPLDWKEYPVTAESRFYGFDISREGIRKRKEKVSPAGIEIFDIRRESGKFRFELQGEISFIKTNGLSLLHEHLLLKMMLNILSTLIMGVLGRYESNLMTWVTPSNNKLIDRAARYVGILLERSGMKAGYAEIVYELFEEMEKEVGTRSLVLDTYSRIVSKYK